MGYPKRLARMDVVVPLHEYLAANPEKAAAWDRDVPPDHRWATDDDGCQCFEFNHSPIVYDRWEGWKTVQVTDGHGTGFHWCADPDDPLGGRWEGSGRPYIILKHGDPRIDEGRCMYIGPRIGRMEP